MMSILCLFFCTLLLPNKIIEDDISGPLIWDINSIERIRAKPNCKEFKLIIKTADDYCKKPPIVITDKKKTFAPNKHYYFSFGTYWWPDSTSTNKFVKLDGKTSPLVKEYDSERLVEMPQRCKILSQAFFLTKKQKYYDAFIIQLKAWFVDEKTYMYPNLIYSQVVPGRNKNKGSSSGMIASYHFNSVIESIRLVLIVQQIDAATMDCLKKWFLSFARWADNGDFGRVLRNTNNNIGTAYDVTLINMYLFGGDYLRAKEIADVFVKRRIEVQINNKGEQKNELRRAKAFTYSVKNLGFMIDFFYLYRFWDSSYYTKNCQLVEKAILFLEQYSDGKRVFPYKQISGMDKCLRDLKSVKKRRNVLVESNIN